jgi:RimJ/RimL family protein N-acetyltransferase
MLRDVVEDDLPFFFEHQRDPEAARMVGLPPRERDAFMTHWRTKVLGNPSNTTRTIVVGGHIAGNVVSWTGDGKRLVGYVLGRGHWGKGIATQALSEFLSHETTRPLFAWVSAHNVGSIRVLEKCGFVRCPEPGGEGKDEAELLFKFDVR